MSTSRFPAIAPPRNNGAPQTPQPFRRSSGTSEEELEQLKETLRQQQHRLSSPRQPRRPDGVIVVSNPVAGQNYAARPYQRITPRKMWEPSFATDKDIVELNDRLSQSEERLETRKREFEIQWSQRRQLFGAASAAGANDVTNGPADSAESPTAKASGSRPTSSKGVAFKDGQRPGSASVHTSKGGRPGSATGASRESIPELQGSDDPFLPMFAVQPESSKDLPPAYHQTPREASMRSTTDTMLGVPEALKRRSSSVKVSQGTIAMLAMLDNTPDLSLPAPKEAGFDRAGDILSENHILKQDLFEAAFTRRDMVGIISGAPYFRMVPKFHIGGVAQAHYHGIRAALNELRKAQTDHACPIVWVNLREEPIIYLNGKSFIIRSRDDPLKPQVIVNISGTRIAQVEEKLRREILAEAAHNQGNICVHHETANGAIEEQWECVDAEDLITLEGIFHQLHQRGLNVEYRRRPITQGAMPTAADFQFVMDTCQSYPLAPVIFCCQTGRGRSSLMMLVASIVRFYQMCKQDIQADVTLLRGDGKATSYRTLQQLIALLPNGALHERRVAVLMELSDKIYSIADHINAALRVGQQTEKSRMRLAQYAYLLIFSCYCEQYFWLKETSLTFPKWVDQFQEIKVLLMNITASRFSTTNLIAERLATPQGVVESDELTNWIRHKRRGHVLCNNMILRSAPKELAVGPATSVAGVVALRQLAEDVPMFTCGRVSETGREELLYNIRSGCPEVTKIAWVSLRAEPMIFINGTSYSLLEYNAAVHHGGSDNASTMHVSRQRLEEIEERLRKDVEQEAAAGDGFVIVHSLSIDGNTEAMRVKVEEVRTPCDVMNEFAASANVTYVRLPLPVGQLLASDLDPLIAHFEQLYIDAENEGETLALVLNDSEGGLRTTIALNVATIIRASRLARLRSFNTQAGLHDLLRSGDRNFTLSTTTCYYGIEEEETLPNYHVELQAASAIVQMVAAGSLLKAVDACIALGGSGRAWNLLHAVDFAKNAIPPTEKTGPAVLEALEAVRKYLLVLLIAIYVDEQGHNPASERAAFSEWLDEYEEIRFMLERLDERPQAALKLIDHRNLMAGHVADDRTVDRRSGDVLTANFAMKADHFPGCQKKGLVPRVCGAPNFRKVDNINVYGVAIPTILGVHNVLTVLGASEKPLIEFNNETNDEEMWRGYPTGRLFDAVTDPSTMERPLRGNVVWVNLREEPIIYVGDRPFVFRDLQLPYVNVELTGIESHKIEHVEDILKADILREADQYQGSFLVHDEGKPGELVGSWEVANTTTVRTVRQVYDEAEQIDGCRVTFLRLPVTDEQSPELKDFDLLVENLLPAILASKANSQESTSFVFNCQMGRGRTTTGMVVCSLLIGRTSPDYYTFLDQKYPELFNASDSDLSKGNYSCVTQLKSLLSDGREAKRRLDLVLEACSRMQNLRTAIEGFVEQVSSPDVPEEARARAHHHGIHYLQRYYNLIAFASYLHEEYDEETQSLKSSFVAWMGERPELVNLHDAASLS